MMLSRAIIASRDLILDKAEAQRMALFFDSILIYGLNNREFSKEEHQILNADLEYLRENGVVRTCMIGVPAEFRSNITDNVSRMMLEEIMNETDVLLPFSLDTSLPKETATEKYGDRFVHHIAKQIEYKGYPVSAHASSVNLSMSGQVNNTLEVTVNNIPLPPENIPWDDLIQFRNEEENVAKLRALRIWLKDSTSSDRTQTEIQEELEHLLYEYRKYMSIQHKKFSQGALSSLISATPQIVANVLSFNFSGALKAICDIRGRHLDLSAAEMVAPGREVSYIAKSGSFFTEQ